MVPRTGVVLAAGRGVRLGQLTESTPKPMLEVAGMALIDRIIHSMVAAGITRLAVVTGYLAEVVESHLASSCPVPVAFVRQPEPNGTGGAVRLAKHAVGLEPFLLAWGDIATDPSHFAAVAGAWNEDLAGVIGVNELPDVSRGSSVVFDQDMRISSIIEKPAADPPSLWNSAGVMAFGQQIWSHLETLEPSSRGEYELTDAIAGLLSDAEPLQAVKLPGRWFDIGTPESLEAARQAFV